MGFNSGFKGLNDLNDPNRPQCVKMQLGYTPYSYYKQQEYILLLNKLLNYHWWHKTWYNMIFEDSIFYDSCESKYVQWNPNLKFLHFP